ncbi:ester cyclase [Pseudonocardia sp. RS010]|uniref:ester cyclase n=1 Tax=Pseudonocardia sp. RS010 TaxID=3385979 RepID=UPI00399FC9AD
MDDLQLIRDEFATWNDRDLDGWLALYSTKAVFDSPGGVHLEGHDGARQFWTGYHEGFPDHRITERRIFGQDGQVLIEGTFEGTHTGPMPTPDGQVVEATGKPVRVPFCVVYLVENEVIVGHTLYFDQMEMLIQLGLVPAAS